MDNDPPFVLRRYEARDHAIVLDLHVRALQVVGAYLGSGPWEHDLYAITDHYLAAGGEFLVGEHDGRVVAMGAFRRTGPQEAEIKRMRVEPEFQGRGYGAQILAALEERAVASGYRRLHLDTSSVQAAALRLYHRAGYVEFHREFRHALELIYYERRLDLSIRSATPNDTTAARALILDGLRDHFGTLDPTMNPDLDAIAAHYLVPERDFLLAFHEGVLAATGALITEAPTVGRIVRMSVRRDLRRLGIGRHMVYHLLTRARGRGISTVEVETTRDWIDAIGLYRRCGFVQYAEDDASVYLRRSLIVRAQPL